jgi:hypothetical protein
VGTVWALFYLWHGTFLSRVPSAEKKEEVAIGLHLAQGHGFASPFDSGPDAPPTSWSPPLYPLLVAGAYRLLGMHHEPAMAVLLLLNAACYGAVAAGLFRLGAQAFGMAAGAVAAGMFLVHPMFLRWVANIWDTYPALAMFVWLAALAGWTRQREGRAGLWRAAGLGAGLGLLLLTNTSYIAAIPLLVWVAAGGRPIRPLLGRAAAATLGMTIVLTPWTVRNYATTGELILVRGNAGFEAWFGNLPDRTGWLDDGSFAYGHPSQDPIQRRALLTEGENAYFNGRSQQFASAVWYAPGKFVARSGRRLAYLFLSDPTAPAQYPLMSDRKWRGYVLSRVAVNGSVLALGLAGVWAAHRLGYRVAGLRGWRSWRDCRSSRRPCGIATRSRRGRCCWSPAASWWRRSRSGPCAVRGRARGRRAAGLLNRVIRMDLDVPDQAPEQAPRRKRWPLTVVRWTVAAAGIAFILSHLAIRDRVLILDAASGCPVQVPLLRDASERSATFLVRDPATGAAREVGRDALLVRPNEVHVTARMADGATVPVKVWPPRRRRPCRGCWSATPRADRPPGSSHRRSSAATGAARRTR